MLRDTTHPIVPVYLNQRIIFDMLSMLQGGIATVTNVSEKNSSAAATKNEIEGGAGLNKAFSSLFSINLSAKRGGEKSEGKDTTTNEERVHTTGSLFYKLRELLDAGDLLKTDGPEYVPVPGDLVEFTGSLQRNPVIETIEFLAS
jgi:hypothetical protein